MTSPSDYAETWLNLASVEASRLQDELRGLQFQSNATIGIGIPEAPTTAQTTGSR